MTHRALFSSVVLAVSMFSPMLTAGGTGRLEEGQYLFPNQSLTNSCYFRLTMQGDGNLVTSASTPSNAVWASNTDHRGGYAVMQRDGNFVVYDWADRPQWYTSTYHRNAPHNFVIQMDNGDLEVGGKVSDRSDVFTSEWWSGYSSREGALGQTCVSPEQKTVVTENVDCPGGSTYLMRPISVRRASWCGFFCANDPNCKAYAYTYPAPTGEAAACWLKSTIPAQTSLPGAVCGVIQGR
jgi:hypothetical protein